MLFAPLESMLNRNIKASTAASAACRRLAGKTSAVHLQVSAETRLLSLYFRSDGDAMRLSATSQGFPDQSPATATLAGTPLAFLSMIGRAPESALRTGQVRIEGDAEVAQIFRDLLQNAQPDVEEELSRLIGDVAAHQTAKLARDTWDFGKRAVDTFVQNMAEFLQEESRDVVSRVEADEFNAAVDQIREAVDRAEARLTLLERNRGKPQA
jgi:ubiquinone biosynthesis accessory factor UbiJ